MSEELINDLQGPPLVIGVDLGGTQIRVGVLRGDFVLTRVNMLTGNDATPNRIIPRIFCAIQQVLEEAGMKLNQIEGIGIGIPGPVDSSSGVVCTLPNLPGWDDLPLGEIIRDYSDVPVFIENDANTAGLGEFIFGVGRGCKNMIYLTISTGIGSGIIADGQILAGASGMAGELGHMTIDRNGLRCNCGNIGCLESIASGTAIARRANEEIAAGRGAELLTFAGSLSKFTDGVSDPLVLSTGGVYQVADESTSHILHVDAPLVACAAKAGVPLAREIITDVAEGLGVGLVNIIHLFNPDIIILGGGVVQIGSMLMKPALRIVQERSMKMPQQAVRIVQAQLGADVGIIGAGALIDYNKAQDFQQEQGGMTTLFPLHSTKASKKTTESNPFIPLLQSAQLYASHNEVHNDECCMSERIK